MKRPSFEQLLVASVSLRAAAAADTNRAAGTNGVVADFLAAEARCQTAVADYLEHLITEALNEAAE